MDKDKIFSTYIDTDIASLYPKRCYIPYKDMYELERIRKTMKEGTRVTFIGSSPKFFGKIGTVVGVKIEHDYGSCPIATVEVVLDDIPGRFGFDPNALALVDASKLELEEIRDILIDSNAVSCDVESYLPESCSGHSIYRIPTGYIVQVDYNKLAMAIYNAGYRRKENKDDR